MPTRLLLVRHGETDDNANRVFQGRHGRGLNDRGRAQATRLAERVKHRKIERIVASDLERAHETASIVGRRIGVVVEPDPNLREVDVGAWTGLSYAEVERRFGDEWEAWRRGEDVRRGGGETYAELGARIANALNHVAATSGPGDVLVVSHGAAIRTYVCALLGVPVATPALGAAMNTGVTTILHEPSGAKVLTWNDVAHLE